MQRAINTLSVSVDKCLLDSSKKIAGTARSVDRWRADLFLMLENVREENGRLEWSKQKIRKAQTALGVICSISVECLERRSFRLDTDLTLDPGQVELIKVDFFVFIRALSRLPTRLDPSAGKATARRSPRFNARLSVPNWSAIETQQTGQVQTRRELEWQESVVQNRHDQFRAEYPVDRHNVARRRGDRFRKVRL